MANEPHNLVEGKSSQSFQARNEQKPVDAEQKADTSTKSVKNGQVDNSFHECFKDRRKAKEKLLRIWHHDHLDILHQVFETQQYDGFISSVVVFNLVLIVLETDCEAGNRPVLGWVNSLNAFILAAFVVEVAVKMFVYQKSYVHNFWNVLDLTIVSLDVFSLILNAAVGSLPNMSIFRIVRLVRLSRSVKFLNTFPELGLMLSALKGALKSLAWGMVLLMLVLTIFGIMAVQIVHPVNQTVASRGTYDGCERCSRAFESVWMAVLTLFQTVIAGDSWGTVAVPISEESFTAWLFFVLVIVMTQILLLNVILAAVLDSATQARADNVEIVAKEKEREMKKNKQSLKALCLELDEDENGSLTYQEVLDGFTKNEAFFDIMESMDIYPEDIASVWGILDRNHLGHIDYEEFAEELFKLKCEDAHTMMVFIKYQIALIQETVQTQMERMEAHTELLEHGKESRAEMLEHMAKHTELLEHGKETRREMVERMMPVSSKVSEARHVEEVESKQTDPEMEAGASKSSEAKLLMLADNTQRGDGIFEKIRAMEGKLDAIKCVVDSLSGGVQRLALEDVPEVFNSARLSSGSAYAPANSGLLTLPPQPVGAGQFRGLPSFYSDGASTAVPPSSVLSRDPCNDSEAQARGCISCAPSRL